MGHMMVVLVSLETTAALKAAAGARGGERRREGINGEGVRGG